MGQGGLLALVNGTSYRWRQAKIHSYQMTWRFPDFIEPFSKAHVYVEWGEGIFIKKRDDAAEVQYVMDQAGGRSFQIQARFRHLQVLIENFSVAGIGSGSIINIGWAHDGTIMFILAGRLDERGNDEFFSSGCDMRNWMKSEMSVIGNMTLKKLCIAGSHDSGMSVSLSPTVFGLPELVLTQTKAIGDQLAMGIRFFDIRPIIGGGQYYTGHYSKVDAINGFQGARGQSISEIVDQVNSFTSQATGELIILKVGHSLNTDVGNSSYRKFTKEEWVGLISKLQGISHLFISDQGTDLINTTLNTFLGQGTSTVAIVIDDDELVQLGDLIGKGFYRLLSNCNIYDVYANMFGVNEMKRNQFEKMSNPAYHNNKLFMLNWICTPQTNDIALVISSKSLLGKLPADSVLDRAASANQSVCDIFEASGISSFPNIILADRIENTNMAAISIAINLRNAFQR